MGDNLNPSKLTDDEEEPSEMSFGQPISKEFSNTLSNVQERIRRIMERVHVVSKGITEVRQELIKVNEIEQKVYVDAAQSAPTGKLELLLFAERIGDTVACQTLEGMPMSEEPLEQDAIAEIQA